MKIAIFVPYFLNIIIKTTTAASLNRVFAESEIQLKSSSFVSVDENSWWKMKSRVNVSLQKDFFFAISLIFMCDQMNQNHKISKHSIDNCTVTARLDNNLALQLEKLTTTWDWHKEICWK